MDMDNVVLYVHKIQIEITKSDLKTVFSRYGIIYKIDIIKPFNKSRNKIRCIFLYNRRKIQLEILYLL